MPVKSFNPDSLPLRDIHLPAEISWWPPAPGWWILLLASLLFIGAIHILRQRIQRRRFRRLALSQLSEIEQNFLEQADSRQLLQDLSRLLRKAALLHFPQSTCAGLVGEAWLTFLDQKLEGKPFSRGVGTLLIEGPYKQQVEAVDAEKLLSLCRTWLHRLPPGPKSQRGQR